MMKSALSVLSLGLILSAASTAAAASDQGNDTGTKTQQNKDEYIVVFKPGLRGRSRDYQPELRSAGYADAGRKGRLKYLRT